VASNPTRPKAEYSPVQLWETPRGARDREAIDVDGPVRVLYDATERPVRRSIGFRPTWGRRGE
jgi:hypothetical protein